MHCNEKQLGDDEYNVNVFGSQISDNNHHADEATFTDEISINSNIDENSIIDYSDVIANRSAWSRQNSANRRFEIMLFQLIMTHRASLAMFDDICQLVDKYTSSPDFTVSSKLFRRKSFIRSLENS